MLCETLKKELEGIRFELIDLNQAAYYFVRKTNRLSYIFRETNRKFVLEEFSALRYLENGLILHLTNLDDDNANYSFRKAHKEINKKSNDAKQIKRLKDLVTKYRQNINNIKTKHRNARIAHINSLEYPNIDEFLNFESELKPLIQLANEIGDFLWGDTIQIKFRLGSLEGVIDFRKEMADLQINVNKNQSF